MHALGGPFGTQGVGVETNPADEEGESRGTAHRLEQGGVVAVQHAGGIASAMEPFLRRKHLA